MGRLTLEAALQLYADAIIADDGTHISGLHSRPIIAQAHARGIEAILAAISQESVRSEALADMFAMIDEGLLVRDISKDHLNGWAARQIVFVQRLAKNKAALQSPARVAEDGPDFNAEVNLHADTVAERHDAAAEQKDVHSTELRK